MADNTLVQTNVGVPDWAQQYLTGGDYTRADGTTGTTQGLLSQAAALYGTNQEMPLYGTVGEDGTFQGYQRLADYDPMQTQAWNAAKNMGVDPATTQAASMAGAAGHNAGQLSYNPYQSSMQSVNAPNLQNYQMQGPAGVSSERISAPQLSNLSMQAAQSNYNPAANLNQYQMGNAQQVGTQSFIQPGTAGAYMSPYMQQVVDIQKREANRTSDIQRNVNQAQAVGQGAFGGSRSAIVEAERQRNLGTQLGDIQAQGSQASYQQAQQQFNAEQQARLTAQQANQQAGLTTGQANLGSALQTQGLGANLGAQYGLANLANQQQSNLQNLSAGLQTQGLGAQTGMQAAQSNQQAGLQAALANQNMGYNVGNTNLQAQLGTQNLYSQQAMQAALANQSMYQNQQQLGEQSRQYGAGLSLQGLQTQAQAAGQLGLIGNQAYTQQMGINQLQSQYGGQQQALKQQEYDRNYQDFLNQMNYPSQQLTNYANIVAQGLRGAGTSTTQTLAPPPSTMQNIGTLGMAAAGVGSLFNKAKGGTVGYARGGMVGSGGLGAIALNTLV